MNKRVLQRRSVVVGGACGALGVFAGGCGDDGPAGDGTGGQGTGSTGAGSTGGAVGSGGNSVDESTGSGAAEGSSAEGSTGVADTTASESASNDGTSSTGEAACDVSGWLAGGTASMAGDYPDPFDDEREPACTVTSTQTCGPCFVTAPERMDVTSGVVGLPVRLSLRVLWEQTCEPVADAVVDLWYTNFDGSYSGQTPSMICSNGIAEATQADFHRGRLTTDAEGKVHFDAVYPGWYPGRSPHVHVLVTVEGTQHHVTQFYFDDALSDSIYAEHPDYSHRPNKDTSNAQDGPFDPGAPNYLATRQTYDCAMQAWGTMLVSAAPGPVNC